MKADLQLKKKYKVNDTCTSGTNPLQKIPEIRTTLKYRVSTALRSAQNYA